MGAGEGRGGGASPEVAKEEILCWTSDFWDLGPTGPLPIDGILGLEMTMEDNAAVPAATAVSRLSLLAIKLGFCEYTNLRNSERFAELRPELAKDEEEGGRAVTGVDGDEVASLRTIGAGVLLSSCC
jgi:hypothetical protein